MNISQPQQQSQTKAQRHVYTRKQLAVLVIVAFVSMLLISGDYVFQRSLGRASGPLALMGFTIYLLAITTIMIDDWRGFLTMNGFLKWKRMRGGKKLLVGCLFFACNGLVFVGYFCQTY